MKIITNNHYRPVLYWHELTAKEQDELKDSYDTIEESTFFRYRSKVYDLGEFMAKTRYNNLDPKLHGWDGYQNDSYFSSVLIQFDKSCEAVKVGLALS